MPASPMNDPVSIASALEQPAAPLQFPFADPPAPGTAVEAAPGVFWLRMPLPYALDHINLWLLRDGDGWTIVDCGLNTDATRDLWEQLFASLLADAPVRRVIVTHYHPDHFGLAGWLTRRFDVELWMTQGEFLTAHAVCAEVAGYGVKGPAALFARHGLDEERLASIGARGNAYKRTVSEPPAQIRRIMEGDSIAVHGRSWRVIVGYGHAPEHAALYCEELGVLISGDMILPRISTNVSVWPSEPNGNPLRLFLESVARYAELPATTLVLPSHGLPFHGLRTRAAQLAEHHDQRLAELLAACTQPASAADVLPVLFRRKLDGHQIFFAMGEAIAHLNYLVHQGRLTSEQGPDGVIRFQRRH